MNLIPGVIREDARSLAIHAGLTIAIPPLRDTGPGRAVTIGVRPEKLRPYGDDPVRFDIRAELIEMLGADSFLHGVLTASDTDVPIIARIERRANIAIGESVSLRASACDCHFFDTQSGRRIDVAIA
jgi:ABC-type sugar transport system ATPase subunit